MLDAHPAEGETPSFKGSMMMAVAENEDEVRKILENDIYVKSGVWDMEKAQIIAVSLLMSLFCSWIHSFAFSFFSACWRGTWLICDSWGFSSSLLYVSSCKWNG